MRSLLKQLPGSISRANAAAYAGSRLSRYVFHEHVVRTAAHCGIQIDHLYFGKRCELLKHFVGGIAFEGFFPPLHQLHHFAAHQINTGNNHIKRKVDFSPRSA
jgi:hypothetical protein